VADELEIADWDIPPGVLPHATEADTIYLVPGFRDPDGLPAYRPESMFLQKGAASQEIRLEYALPENERRFVDYFAPDPEEIQLWLAAAGPITDVLLFGLGYMVNGILRRRGANPDAIKATPLHLRIATLDPRTGKAKGVRLRGNASDVIVAVEALKQRP
jgi:hypothetical protein